MDFTRTTSLSVWNCVLRRQEFQVQPWSEGNLFLDPPGKFPELIWHFVKPKESKVFYSSIIPTLMVVSYIVGAHWQRRGCSATAPPRTQQQRWTEWEFEPANFRFQDEPLPPAATVVILSLFEIWCFQVMAFSVHWSVSQLSLKQLLWCHVLKW